MQLNKIVAGMIMFILIIGIIAFLFNVQIAPVQITILVILFIISVAMFMGKSIFNIRGSGMTSIEALEFVKKEWQKIKKGEELITTDSLCRPRYYGIKNPKKFYGFVLHRKSGETMKPLVVIVSTNPKNIYWVDNPSPQQLTDPFDGFSPTLKGGPVKDVYEPLLRDKGAGALLNVNIGGQQQDADLDKLKGKKKD